jgi:hypothetical protein
LDTLLWIALAAWVGFAIFRAGQHSVYDRLKKLEQIEEEQARALAPLAVQATAGHLSKSEIESALVKIDLEVAGAADRWRTYSESEKAQLAKRTLALAEHMRASARNQREGTKA